MQSFVIETRPDGGFTLCITRSCGHVERLYYALEWIAQEDAGQAPDDRKCWLCKNRDILARTKSAR